MRRYMIAGNWKMYKTPQESSILAGKICEAVGDMTHADIVVCPAFVSLLPVYEITKKTQVRLGAQNFYPEDEGAFTGEISAPMLKEIGCKYIIIGHSERRAVFGETDDDVNRKLAACFRWNLTPIVCVGETLAQREADDTEKVIKTQIEGALEGVSEDQLMKAVIAYEPVWAIGTGKTAAPEQANAVHSLIRGIVGKKYSEKCSSSLRILYGGSVKPGNAEGLFAQEDIDGALVGGASLDAASFGEIVKSSRAG
jgi:triosephosphate isomerase (TIM)